ncbi:MAG TPA: RHS repeat-associated core domain-containing protein [Solirubrobacteraceae bacterium]|nr:RHS repeat-associated core domain-containing protein [Solirubrobacteraceae bacterium]
MPGSCRVVGRFVALGALALAAFVLCMAPASASAEGLCTDTWVGPAEGSWETAADWSTGHLPTSTDVACIGGAKTVVVSGGAQEAGVVQGEGKLEIAGGSLEVSSALEPSVIADLTLGGASFGTLKGAGTVEVTGALVGFRGYVEDSLVVESGARGTVTNLLFLYGTLTNDGSFTIEPTDGLGGEEHARFVNNGTLTIEGNDGSDTSLYRRSTTGPAPALVNDGTVRRVNGEKRISVPWSVANDGTIEAAEGQLYFSGGGVSGTEHVGSWITSSAATIEFSISGYGPESFALGSSVTMSGNFTMDSQATVTAGNISGGIINLTLEQSNTTLELTNTSPVAIQNLTLKSGATLSNTNAVELAHFMFVYGGNVAGSGKFVIEPGATAELYNEFGLEQTLVNEGTFTVPPGAGLEGYGTGVFINDGTLNVNGTDARYNVGLYRRSESERLPELLNYGTLRKTEGGPLYLQIEFKTINAGIIEESGGPFHFITPVLQEESMEWGGGEENLSAPYDEIAECGESVGCGGNFSQTQTDFAIGGRGVGLDLTRTYNSQAAVAEAATGVHGIFGYGWSNSFSDHLVLEPANHLATLVQADGSTVPFTEDSGEAFTGPAWSQDVLSGSSGSGFTLTLENQTVYKFAGATGRLESVTDRNGNATTLAYNGGGELEAITDAAGRKITLAYNAKGLVESATDPMKHVVKYEYDAEGDLKSVTQPGEAALRWQFVYEGHELTEMTDGRGGKTVNKYNTKHQEIEQTDPASRTTVFEYFPFRTVTTNKATGAKTVDYLTSGGEAAAITKGYGTALATTESFTYNSAGERLSVTDGNGHTTTYGYDTHGNRTSVRDPETHETKWTYDSTHDVETETKPNGEKATFKLDSHGNVLAEERPAPGETTQSTTYKYDEHGDRESMTNPVGQTWKYEYDAAGDRTAEIDPLGNKRTWGYNEDSQEISMVSPRGHASGAEEAKFKTTTERDAQGRPLKITDPLGHTTKYTYDADGNVETKTDGESNATTYTYDADNEPTKVKEPNGTVTETGYDGAGQVTSQTDGNKHTTVYVRNVLEQVTEEIDPLGRKTLKEYDSTGNLTGATDAAKRKTTYRYNADNRISEVTYSDGKTPTVTYEYNADGLRTKMKDGTGTSIYTYDQLDRLTEAENGNKEIVKYEYDLANHQTKITYPSGKAVTRAFDKDGRLEKVTDWLSHATTFAYDQDSDPKATVYPSETKDEDTYTYNDADQMTETKMLKSTETLASLVYTRNNDGEVKKTASKKLPGAESIENGYDPNSRLTKSGSTEYKYDAANNPTTEGSSTNTYNEADELQKGTGVTYTYNEVGERTKAMPEKGPATTYGYDQAGDLITVERPETEGKAKIEDSYTYDGNGLRASQSINGAATHFAWDTTEEVPLIVTDATNSYIYAPGGLAVEQINNSTGAALYLHHDQAGSTRLLTGSTGKVEGKCSYGAYGTPTCEGTATPLGYDGQYISNDTGLIYLRARNYEPATAQFLSVDPRLAETRVPYAYAEDNPMNLSDPTGLRPWSPQIKQAQSKCQSWKAWHSKKSPFYGNQNIYHACLDLLSLPSQVYGTGGQGGGSITTGERVGAICSASGSGVALITRGVSGGPEVAGGAATFCFGYTAGELIVDPLLHDIAPSVFAE